MLKCETRPHRRGHAPLGLPPDLGFAAVSEVLHRGMAVFGSIPNVAALGLHDPAVNFVFRMEKLGTSWEDIRLSSKAAMESFLIPSLACWESGELLRGRWHPAVGAGREGSFGGFGGPIVTLLRLERVEIPGRLPFHRHSFYV